MRQGIKGSLVITEIHDEPESWQCQKQHLVIEHLIASLHAFPIKLLLCALQ